MKNNFAYFIIFLSIIISSCGTFFNDDLEVIDVDNEPGELISIEINPTDPSIQSGENCQFRATGHYASGTKDITSEVTWVSSPSSLAYFNESNDGLLIFVARGDIEVYAYSGSITSNKVEFTIEDIVEPILTSIVISANTYSIKKGENLQFSATGYYSNGTDRDITSEVTWSSSNGEIAYFFDPVMSPGLLMAWISGVTNVKAELDEIFSSIEIVNVSNSQTLSNNTNLNEFKIFYDGQIDVTGRLSEPYTNDRTSYSIKIYTAHSSLTFQAQPEDENARVEILEDCEMPRGETVEFEFGNTLMCFKIIAGDGSERTFVIHVERIKNYFVAHDSEADTPDGLSWATAFKHPMDVIKENSHDPYFKGKIWVKEGTYNRLDSNDAIIPDTSNGDLHFLGGFSDSDSFPEDRDYISNPTILDGNYSSQPIVQSGKNSSIDGFTIQGSTYIGIHISYYNYSVRNCIVRNNTHGIYISNGRKAELESVIINSNGDDYSGWGLVIEESEIDVINCLIFGNHGQIGTGAGIYMIGDANSNFDTTTLNLLYTTIVDNNGNDTSGSGIYSGNDAVEININSSIIARNGFSSYDANIYCNGCDVNAVYSDIQGWTSLSRTVFSEDPLNTFDSSSGGYYLKRTSKCVNGGDTDIERVPQEILDILITKYTHFGGVPDDGQPDIGYHYPESNYSYPSLNE